MRRESATAQRLALLSWIGAAILFLLPVNASAQREGRRELREDAAYAELIHRLEMGMSALEELGRRDALEVLERVADEVRAERKEARNARGGGERGAARERESGNDRERESARRLVEALRLTETACREGERPDAGDLAKHAYRALEMQLEGRRDPEARQYIERAPSLGAKIELLAMASELWADWGHEKKAALTGEVAATLREQWERKQERQRAESRVELESLEGRVEILRWARGALAEAGRREKAGLMERFIHVGELQLAGARELEIGRAFEGLSMEMAVGLLEEATRLYAEWKMDARARACRQLAGYYAQRERVPVEEERALETPPDAEVRRLLRRLDEIQKELQEIRSLLEREIRR